MKFIRLFALSLQLLHVFTDHVTLWEQLWKILQKQYRLFFVYYFLHSLLLRLQTTFPDLSMYSSIHTQGINSFTVHSTEYFCSKNNTNKRTMKKTVETTENIIPWIISHLRRNILLMWCYTFYVLLTVKLYIGSILGNIFRSSL